MQSDLITVHGASAVSVARNIASFAFVYSSHLSSDARSIGESFHCLSGCASRSSKRRALLLAAHREPELDEVDAAAHEVPLELGRLAQELDVLLLGAEAHDALDAGAVVPGAVEHHDLAGGGQVLHVALEIPLAALDLGRLLQRDDARAARIEVLHEALDRAALAGGVAAFEQDDDLLPGRLDPRLQLQQLDLQPVLLPLVAPARKQVQVRIAASRQSARSSSSSRSRASSTRACCSFEESLEQRRRVVGRDAVEDVAQRRRFDDRLGLRPLRGGVGLDRVRRRRQRLLVGGRAQARCATPRGGS